MKPHNIGGLFAIMTLIGVSSVTMLPVSLELACELTRNADGSSAILWFTGNLFGVIFVLSQGALRAGPNASPPLNMYRALVFNGVFVITAASTVFLIRGVQKRKQLDELKLQEALSVQAA